MTEVPLEIDTVELNFGQIRAGIEAILLVTDQPLDPISLAATLSVSQDQVEKAFAEISKDLRERFSGLELRNIAGGFRLYTTEQAAGLVEKYIRDGQVSRLTQASLETLAVVAYKQPVSRARISAIRGVNVDSVIKTLESRGLIEVKETEADSGALLYGTTSLFLEKLGLASVDDLPPFADYLPDISTAVALGESL